ncbi:MAG: branched-chain amino acid ABC transporter permease [Desulfobacteraceae bacterium]
MTKITYEHLMLVIIAVLLAVMPLVAVVPQAWILYAFVYCIYLSMSCMWNLIAGYSGLISLCQPAFLGLAGYTLALGTWVNVPWWAGLIGGAIVAGIFAVLIAFAVFRLSGVYFAIGTLVVPEALRSVFILWRPVGGSMTGGGAGYMIKKISGISINEIYWMALAIAVVSIVIFRLILNSNLGLGLTAVRDNQRAASSCGINTFRLKLYPFVIGAVITGLTGAVYYIYQGFIEPTRTFNVSWTMAILLATVIGGMRTKGGAILGTMVYVFLYFVLARYGGYSLLIQGAILIAIILISPQGLLGILNRFSFYRSFVAFMERPVFEK